MPAIVCENERKNIDRSSSIAVPGAVALCILCLVRHSVYLNGCRTPFTNTQAGIIAALFIYLFFFSSSSYSLFLFSLSLFFSLYTFDFTVRSFVWLFFRLLFLSFNTCSATYERNWSQKQRYCTCDFYISFTENPRQTEEKNHSNHIK